MDLYLYHQSRVQFIVVGRIFQPFSTALRRLENRLYSVGPSRLAGLASHLKGGNHRPVNSPPVHAARKASIGRPIRSMGVQFEPVA